MLLNQRSLLVRCLWIFNLKEVQDKMRVKKVVHDRQEPGWEEWVSSAQPAGGTNRDHPVDLKGSSDALMHEVISKLAYSYWEARGFPGGSAEEDWLRAEAAIQLTGIRLRTNVEAELAEPTSVAASNRRLPQIKRLAATQA